MAGVWISAWSATSLSRVPAYPFRLSTCAAAARIRSLVRADLEPPSSGTSTSCFLDTPQIIGSQLSPAPRGGIQSEVQAAEAHNGQGPMALLRAAARCPFGNGLTAVFNLA